jgi:hypothetical protein
MFPRIALPLCFSPAQGIVNMTIVALIKLLMMEALVQQVYLRTDVTFVMVTHGVSDGMIVVEKGHPRKKLQPSDFPALDPGKIREELKLSNSKKLLLLFAWTLCFSPAQGIVNMTIVAPIKLLMMEALVQQV